MATNNISTVKVYLKSKTEDGIINKQFQNNQKFSTPFDYKIIYAKGFWWAWFDMDLNALRVLKMTKAVKNG